MRAPLLYRVLLNPLRIWLEDSRAPEYGYVGQMKAWWRTDVEHRTERPRPAGQIVVVRWHDHGPAAHLRPAHGVSALRLWTAAQRALSRLLALRGRRRLAAREAWQKRRA